MVVTISLVVLSLSVKRSVKELFYICAICEESEDVH